MSKPVTAAQVRDALLVLKRDGGDPWPLIESFMLHFAERAERAETALRFVAAKCKAAGILDGAPQAQAEPEGEVVENVAGPINGTRVGADGQPMSPQQQSVEEAMDAAIQAGGGQVAPQPKTRPTGAAPVPGQKPLPPRGGVRMPPPGAEAAPVVPQDGGTRIGADGSPITDPQQLAAEAAMDAALSG